MLAEENKDMVRRYIEAINTDDFDELSKLVAADFVDQAQVSGMPSGIEGVKQAHIILRTAFPDVHFTIEDLMAEGNKVVVRATGSGNHKGPFYGVAPTGKQVTWSGMRILYITNGKFVEGVNEFDQMGILQQLGVIPPLGEGSN